MSAANWKNLAEFVGVLAIVGSLIFVGLEVRQQQQVALNESGFHLVDNLREVHSAVIENADIWVKGNAGEDLDSTEAAIFEEIIYIYWGAAYWTATTQARVGQDLHVAIHDFAGFLHRNPGARRVWQSRMAVEQSYRERLLPEPVGVEFMKMVEADLEKLTD